MTDEITITGTAFPMPQGRGMVAIVPDDATSPVVVADGSRDQTLFWRIVSDMLDGPPSGEFALGREGVASCRLVSQRVASPANQHDAAMRMMGFLSA